MQKPQGIHVSSHHIATIRNTQKGKWSSGLVQTVNVCIVENIVNDEIYWGFLDIVVCKSENRFVLVYQHTDFVKRIVWMNII